jgi:hypothetical protein
LQVGNDHSEADDEEAAEEHEDAAN